MSLERSKFYAGTRGADTNAFYGCMALGAGEGGGVARAARERYTLMMRQQQAEAVNRARMRAAATAVAKKVLASTTSKSGKVRVAGQWGVSTGEASPKKVQATTAIQRNRNNAVRHQHRHVEQARHAGAAGGKTAATGGKRGAQRMRRVALRGRTESKTTKWLLMPQSNFKQCSESSSEDAPQISSTELQAAEAMPHMSLKTSWPNIASSTKEQQQQQQQRSRVFLVPSQRIMLKSDLQQAQLQQLQPKRVRSQRQQLSVSKTTLLLQTDDVRKTASADNSDTHSPSLSLNSSTLCSDSNSSCGYQTTLGISCSSSGIWSTHKPYKEPIVQQINGNKSVKLTSTVIKIMPELPACKQPAAVKTTAAALKTAIAKPATAALRNAATVAGINKPVKRVFIKPQQRQTSPTPTLPKPKQQQSPRIGAGATPPTATVAPKIVRKEQHKVPRTVEDGIDISYQYFVSTPLARGKKPMPIRYLYRPMVRRLNATTAAKRRSSKKSQSTSTNNTETEQASTSPGSSEVETDSESEHHAKNTLQQLEKRQSYDPPPIVVDAKYLPFVKQLNNYPMPPEQLPNRHQQQLAQQQEQQLAQQQQQQQQQLVQQQQLAQQQQQQLAQQQQQQHAARQQQQQMLIRMQQQLQQQQELIYAQQQQLLAQEQQQLSLRPKLIDFQPNVTRIGAVGGANICYHAPIRMSAGATTTTTTATIEIPTEATAVDVPAATTTVITTPELATPAATTKIADIELQNCSKCVKFHLENDNSINSDNSNSKHSKSNSNSNCCSCSSCNSCLAVLAKKTKSSVKMTGKSDSSRKKRKSKSRSKKKSRK